MTQPETAVSGMEIRLDPKFEMQAVLEQRDAAMNDAARWKAVAIQTLGEKREAEQEILRLREKVAADEEPTGEREIPAGIPLPAESRARRSKTPTPE